LGFLDPGERWAISDPAARTDRAVDDDHPGTRVREIFLTVTVTDDGSGLGSARSVRPAADERAQPGAGHGLATMRERAEELGGTLAVVTASSGTVVTAILPLGPSAPSTTGAASPTHMTDRSTMDHVFIGAQT
jgi:signal transduction histidine kinase